jgi:hypothetical protein
MNPNDLHAALLAAGLPSRLAEHGWGVCVRISDVQVLIDDRGEMRRYDDSRETLPCTHATRAQTIPQAVTLAITWLRP